jgi:hypothetical protein
VEVSGEIDLVVGGTEYPSTLFSTKGSISSIKDLMAELLLEAPNLLDTYPRTI